MARNEDSGRRECFSVSLSQRRMLFIYGIHLRYVDKPRGWDLAGPPDKGQFSPRQRRLSRFLHPRTLLPGGCQFLGDFKAINRTQSKIDASVQIPAGKQTLLLLAAWCKGLNSSKRRHDTNHLIMERDCKSAHLVKFILFRGRTARRQSSSLPMIKSLASTHHVGWTTAIPTGPPFLRHSSQMQETSNSGSERLKQDKEKDNEHSFISQLI